MEVTGGLKVEETGDAASVCYTCGLNDPVLLFCGHVTLWWWAVQTGFVHAMQGLLATPCQQIVPHVKE